MNILFAISKGFQDAWKYKRIVLLLYIFTFLLAAVVAYPFKSLLESTIGHSLMVEDMVKGFDYTFLNDFKNAYGVAFNPIINQSVVVLGLYLLLFIFFMGGIVATFIHNNEAFDQNRFWGQSAHYFWRIFRLSSYFLFLHGAIFFVYFSAFYNVTSGFSLFELDCECTISNSFYSLTPIYLLVAAFFFMWQDLTKIFLLRNDNKWVYQGMWVALKFLRQNFFAAYGLYLLNALLWIVVVGINGWLSAIVEFTGLGPIMLSFIISQVFVLCRLYLKLVNIGSLVNLVERNDKDFVK